MATSTKRGSTSGNPAPPATSRSDTLLAGIPPRIFALVTVVIAIILYFLTLAPVVTFVDSGELAAVIASSGVSHPSGSPFYIMVAQMVRLIPFRSLIWRLNAFSAVCAALSVGVTFLAARLYLSANEAETEKKGKKVQAASSQGIAVAGGFAAALAWMTNRALWSTATVTEVYALHAFLLSLLALLMARYSSSVDDKKRNRSLAGAAFVSGLAIANYPPFGMAAPAVLVLLLKTEGSSSLLRWKRNLLLLFCVALGLLPYVTLPLRASMNPILNWGNPSNWERFVKHVTAAQYSIFLGPPKLSVLPQALSLWWDQWPAVIWILLVPGIFFLYKRNRALFLFSAVLGISNLLYVLSYDITDVSSAPSDYYTYLLPLCWCSAVWIGAGIFGLLQWLRAIAGTPWIYALAFLPVIAGVWNYRELDRSRYTYADDFSRNILVSVAPNALILSPDWTFVSPSLYLQFGEGVRDDVVVLDGELLRRSWYLLYVQNRAPWLYEATRDRIEAFLAEVGKYERGEPYNGESITTKYVDMLNGMLEEASRQNHPPYILLNLEAKEMNPVKFRAMETSLKHPPYVTIGAPFQSIGENFTWVPETLAFRLYSNLDRVGPLPEARIPPRSIDPSRRYDNVTLGVFERYAEFWRQRGDYLRPSGCAPAREAYQRAVEIVPNLPEAVAALSECR